MRPIRLSSEARREAILIAARACFARHGYAGTTTRSVAAAAGISEALLFRHFPSKAALYGEIMKEACEADPELQRLQAQEPSTATLVLLVTEMVRHFLTAVTERPDEEEIQRIKLLTSSHLDDGDFARLLHDKIGDIIGQPFTASLARAIACGDAVPLPGPPINLFWFAHQLIHMIALTYISKPPSLAYGDTRALGRQVSIFMLRGLGLRDHAIDHYFRDAPAAADPTSRFIPESASS
jgi:AcrR family transcriptional regulator